MRPTPLLTSLLLFAALGGCDMLGIEGASVVAAKREVEGKAVGGACRHAGRAIEDCYTLNRKADKGAVFAGWREMNDYMRENKIDAVAPALAATGASALAANTAAGSEDEAEAPAAGQKKPAAKSH